MNAHDSLHDGSLWFLLACLAILVGVVVGLFTERGSGISHHPYTKPELGGELAADLPPESIGRAELEHWLWRRPAPRGPALIGASSRSRMLVAAMSAPVRALARGSSG